MLFISAERSKQNELTTLYKTLYNGSSKLYPNCTKMLFISLTYDTLSSTPFWEKIYYNHEKCIGEETVHRIGGLQDLKTLIHIKGSPQQISIHTLLKSLPASPGITSSQLYHHAEPNSTSKVTMVVYHKSAISLWPVKPLLKRSCGACWYWGKKQRFS